MRKPTSKRSAKPATTEAASNPATVVDGAADATTVPPVAPVAVDSATVAKPDPVAVAADRRVARDAASIARHATHYGATSIRDDAYLALYARAAGPDRNAFTLRDVFDAGTDVGGKRHNPFYVGSSKATDVGAVNRAIKAGNVVATNVECTAFEFTERGAKLARAALAKLAKPA